MIQILYIESSSRLNFCCCINEYKSLARLIPVPESEIPVLLLPVGAGLVDVKHGKRFAGNQRIVFFRKAKNTYIYNVSNL